MEITYDILKLMSQEDKISLFTKLLSDTKRTGISNVIHVLDNTDFYVAPSSTRFHGNYAGGLLDHSLLVYALCENMFAVVSKLKPGILSSIEHESIVISSLLHDVCKCGLYRQEVKRRLNPDNNQWESYVGYNTNDRFPIGHGDKSVIMLQEWGLSMTVDEMLAIRWHMGTWDGSAQQGMMKSSYDTAINICPLISLIQNADNMSSLMLEDCVVPEKI